MRRLPCFTIALVLSACGGKSSSPATSNTTPDGPAAAKLPWEAALTVGAAFTLVDEIEESGGEPVTVKVANVEDKGSERVYTLDWGEGANGPTAIIVRGNLVLINDAKPEAMQEAFDTPMGTCYGEDFSNPDGCDDVCDAHLCMNDTGIVSVDGLYAPGYGMYRVQ